MTTAPTGAVELLDRSLGYTRVILASVCPDHLDRPTPCRDWSLADLLAHLEDALDAFTEAAGGTLRMTVRPGPGSVPSTHRLQDKACALLGAWSGATPDGVCVEGRDLASDLLVAAAALEITVHGWDVGQAIGTREPIPDELAEHLLQVARLLVHQEDRAVRFARPRSVGSGAGPGERLLAHLGRG